MKKLLYLLFFSIIISFQAISQEKFISLGDEAGIILSSEEKDRINYAVNDALSLLSPEESSKFRVYDFGFYIYDTVKGPSVGEIWEDIMLKVEADSESQYYLVFGRVSTSEKLNESIKIRMKLPFSVRECLKNDERQALEGIIYNAAVQHLSANYTNSIVEALGKLKERFHYGLKCACDYYPPDDSCDKYSDFKYLDEKLRGLGFRKKQVAIGESTSWEEGNLGIYDYFRKKIQFDGDGIWYDIADEVSESKAIFDTTHQVLPDTVISTLLKGRVYIHDKNSFINGKWEESIAEANILDYVEYWVVLTDNLGKSFLYSRYTLRGEMLPLAISREGMEIEDRAAYTLSPMGAALKVLGNAAVDACLQAVIIRFTDDNVNSWGRAFQEVNYFGAAWEGVSSLLPWKSSPIKQKLTNALVRSIAVVVDKAVKVPNYTVHQGLNDFIIALSSNIMIQILGDQIVKKGPIVFSGLLRFVKNNSNSVTNRIAGRSFAEFVRQNACFTENTPVIAFNSTLRIKDLELNSWVLSYDYKNSDKAKFNNISYEDNILEQILLVEEFQVEFESIDGLHKCKLILSANELENHRIRNINDVVWLSIPEQGISGNFIVTGIAECQKKQFPSNFFIPENFVFSRVTGIFVFQSKDVWRISFDNGEEIEVTSSHPFLDWESREWLPVFALLLGDEVMTRNGRARLLSKELMPGSHEVYNITVENTHTYLVGEHGYIVHNNCGPLDILAVRFIKYLDNRTKKLIIDEWWAKAWPVNGNYLESIFGRGMFFERLLGLSKFKNWKWTGAISSNFPGIDYYITIAGKNVAASLKTSNMTPSAWLSTQRNRDHLRALVNGLNVKRFQQGPQKIVKADEVRLVIAVPESRFSEYVNFESSVHALKSQIPGVEKIKVEVVTMEKTLGLL